MDDYVPPLADILHALDVVGLDELLTFESFAHVDRDTVETLLTKFGRYASEVVAPTDRIGDQIAAGSTLPPAR